KEKDWGFYKDEKYNIKNELPSKANNILNSKIYKDEEIYSRKLNANMQNNLIVVLQTNKEYINKLNTSLLKEYLVVSIIILFIGYFSLLIIKNVFRDLSTELEKTDLKLKESSNIAKLSFWILDLKTMKLKFDDNWFSMLAFKQYNKEISFEQLAKLEKNNKSLKKLSQAISQMDEKIIIEFYMNDIYSKEVHFLAKFKILKDENNIAKEIEITVQNISEQKQLINSLLKAKKDAELASEAKSRFLANMSHEIRTPLNGIVGLTDLALKTDSITKQKEFLKKSKISSAALLNVINDILDHSKIVAGKLSLEQKDFNLDEVLLNITNLFDYQAYQKGIDLHIKIDPKIPFVLKGDALRISQIFNNLIGNAIKFTQKGYVNISIDLKEISDTKVKIICMVEDSGIGISKENQKKLFKSFEQVDSSDTRIYGGTGLGLTITKDLVSLMNGNIQIESEENKGSRFIFTIDLVYDDSINYNLSSKDIFKAKTFLIVVSCSIDRKILETIFNSWKIDVISCKDVQEALILAKDKTIDYLVVDYLMPQIGGLDVIKKLKEELKINSLNIVMATLFKEKEILQNAKKQNIKIEKIVHKPFTSSSLFDSIITSKKRIHGISKNGDIETFKINANVL
ncbi:ATP-binding protein, partial [Poseidonibacter sp.]|uniref:ATP-binding protein n=1 Tax=Poseidonibacter sp. TaxID=2321188 RepID=UPI003C76BCB3